MKDKKNGDASYGRVLGGGDKISVTRDGPRAFDAQRETDNSGQLIMSPYQVFL